MAEPLTEKGYLATKEKLASMEARLAKLLARTDLHPVHRDAVEASYRDRMRQYLRDIKLYEAVHGSSPTSPPA
jgi:hypothetical protein